MEGDFYIEKKSRLVLEEYHRACLDKKTADRIKAILLISDGFSYAQIEKILLLDERTLNRYKKIYQERGIDGLVANNYQGRQCKLSEEQIEQLKDELRSRLYQTAGSVCEYVEKTYGERYSTKGMVQLLHRMGFSYKKTSVIPGKMDPEKQEVFVKTYQKRYKKLPEDEKVYFLDGSHPTYNSHAGYAWIERGKQYGIPSTDGRRRINLLGAYEPKTAETVVREYATLNQESVIDIMRILRKHNGDKKLHIMLDNVKYQHTKAVKEVARELKIHLKYLPAYSPNLNLIERYWGYLKKHVLKNHYYETFDQFKDSILRFTRGKSKKHKSALLKYIPERFHLVDPPVFT